MRLLVTDSLLKIVSKVQCGDKGRHAPNFSDEVFYRIPCKWTVGNLSPPTHQVWGPDICMEMKVICDWDFVVFEGRSNEANLELMFWVLKGDGWSCY